MPVTCGIADDPEGAPTGEPTPPGEPMVPGEPTAPAEPMVPAYPIAPGEPRAPGELAGLGMAGLGPAGGLVVDWLGIGVPGRRSASPTPAPAEPALPELAGQAEAYSDVARSVDAPGHGAARSVVARSVDEVSGQTEAGWTLPDADALLVSAEDELAELVGLAGLIVRSAPLLPPRSPAAGLVVSTFRTAASGSVPAALPDPSASRVTGSTRLSTRPPAHVLPRGYPVTATPDPRLPRSTPW